MKRNGEAGKACISFSAADQWPFYSNIWSLLFPKISWIFNPIPPKAFEAIITLSGGEGAKFPDMPKDRNIFSFGIKITNQPEYQLTFYFLSKIARSVLFLLISAFFTPVYRFPSENADLREITIYFNKLSHKKDCPLISFFKRQRPVTNTFILQNECRKYSKSWLSLQKKSVFRNIC